MPVEWAPISEEVVIREAKKINKALAQMRRLMDVDREFINGTRRLQRRLLKPVREDIRNATPVDTSGAYTQRRSGHRPGDLRRSVVAVRTPRPAQNGALVATVGFRKKKKYGEPGFVSARQIIAIEAGTSRIRPHNIIRGVFQRRVNNQEFLLAYTDETYSLLMQLLDKELQRLPRNSTTGRRLRIIRSEINSNLNS